MESMDNHFDDIVSEDSLKLLIFDFEKETTCLFNTIIMRQKLIV